MYVEELILRLACEGKYLFDTPLMPQVGWEYNFLNSVGVQIHLGNALTEKQATQCLKIIKRYKTQLEVSFNTSIDLDNPIYQQGFRLVSQNKSVQIADYKGSNAIKVKFPYDEQLIKKIHDYINSTNWRSVQWNIALKELVAKWDQDEKAWIFSLKEENIIWISLNLVPLGFEPDNKFKDYVAEINTVLDNINDHAPMVVKDGSTYGFKNASSKIAAYDTDNVIDFLFYAKHRGITTWDESVDEDFKNASDSPVIRGILNSINALYIDSNTYEIKEFDDVLKFSGPTLIIIPGGSEIEHTVKWHQHALDCGITNDQIAVLFRTPNQSSGGFNQYVRENNLNNEISENTRLVFVSTKIPKPLVKSGIKINTIINLGYYSQIHFSMSVLLQSPPNIVYYNNKQPHGVNVVNS